MKVEYWCNLNLRDKYRGHQATDELVYVGTLDVTGLDDAFEKFNRIDKPVPVLDEAEAPSMSVGDVIHDLDKDEWFFVASFGFTEMPAPDPGRLISGRKVSEVIHKSY